MVRIKEASIYFPIECRVEHRRVGQRIVAFLLRGEVHCETGNNSRTFSYRVEDGDDSDAVMERTERRARLMAAAWACWHIIETNHNLHLTDEERERCEECVGVELSLVLTF